MNRLLVALSLIFALAGTAGAQDAGMFGGGPHRNMVSDATGLPSTFDVAAGTNVLWKQQLGSQSYGGPVLHNGRIYVGTNNEAERNPAITGDKGNVMAFDAESGEFLWQSAHDNQSATRTG